MSRNRTNRRNSPEYIWCKFGKPPPCGEHGYLRHNFTLSTRCFWWTTVVNFVLLLFSKVTCEGRIHIQPFHFPNNVKEGQTVQAFCTLLQGDGDVEFQWLKNGEVVSPDENVSIVEHTDMSRLVIKSVDVRNTGNYTCIAKSKYAQDAYTAELGVRGPPKWLKEPADVSTSLGESVTLTCATYGYPVPDVIWKQANESTPDDWVTVTNGPHTKLESNGSLILHKVRHEHGGLYQCQVSNGIGETLKKTVTLSIKEDS